MKNFKKMLSIMVLTLMLIPLVSFAQERQAGQVDAVKNDISDQTSEVQILDENKDLLDEVEENMDRSQDKLNEDLSRAGEKIKENNMSEQAKNKVKRKANEMAQERKGKVANAVQEMLAVAARSGGIGQEISVIAQEQKENQEVIEAKMEEVKRRGRLKKFFFGSDYKSINAIEDILENRSEKFSELKGMTQDLPREVDAEKLESQIQKIEEVKTELEQELEQETKGFSLFGWLNKMINR
jgi:DNA repair exonuclease SbcCD ATPase subunit